MINYKTGCSKKEQQILSSLILEITDLYGDFYITKNNLRLFIRDNINVLFECLKKGDKVAWFENGMAIVTGFSDNMPRKYLKILSKTDEDAKKLVKIISWKLDCDLYIKIKKNNPLKGALLKSGFQFLGGRGKEILLMKKGEKYVNRDKRQSKSSN